MKKGWYVLSIAFLAAMIGISVHAVGTASQEAKGGEKTINYNDFKINNQDYEKKKKGPVYFTHRKHAYDYKILCWECHHEFDEGKNIWSPWEGTGKCVDCHDPREKIDNMPNLQKAYHLNCKNCHSAMAREGKETGPYKKCAGCHIKK